MIPDQAQAQWQSSIGNGAGPEPNQTPAPPPMPPADGAITAPAAGIGGSGLSAKTVLLVDSNSLTRKSRADMMRKFGVLVDAVAAPATARTRLAAGTYNLILVDLGPDRDGARSLGAEIKARNPRQMVGFFVGSPRFISTSLREDGARAPRAAPPPATAPPVPAPSAGTDFGQRVRDAEAEQLAE
jgi:CheY-like chemotaxis protein